ncbi:Aste57867_24081 [Aphanomyces stellatus]|uniref:Aste57867_24081 protein n=1 Tax=Aphanomyces stellatus TaxID=120398 RepID=A0A485LPJ6_9STRA|nr:hypothetical protein As57867_024008 [Aphanomyces stellatus]VFU00723.1 Aste57867_24081 [Aphanomyces stellatus]
MQMYFMKYKNELTGKGKTGNDETEHPGWFDFMVVCLQDKVGMSAAHIVSSAPHVESEAEKYFQPEQNAFLAGKPPIPWNPPPTKKSDVDKLHQTLVKLVDHVTAGPIREGYEIQEFKSQLQKLDEKFGQFKDFMISRLG